MEKLPQTQFVNTKFGGPATVDELENVVELLAGKINELIDCNERLEKIVILLAKNLDNQAAFGNRDEINQILNAPTL